MNVPLVAAGALALLGAAVHGIGGQLLVVSRLAAQSLPASRFGGPRMTMAMVQVTWHMTTIAFLGVGAALVVAGTAADGDAEQALALTGAAMATGFALLALVLGAAGVRTPRALLRHPAPLLLSATAALAWWGAL